MAYFVMVYLGYQ